MASELLRGALPPELRILFNTDVTFRSTVCLCEKRGDSYVKMLEDAVLLLAKRKDDVIKDLILAKKIGPPPVYLLHVEKTGSE